MIASTPTRHQYRQIFQFVSLFIPVFFLVNTFTTGHIYSGQQLRRETTSSFIKASERIQITLTGTLPRFPTDKEYTALEHALFDYLNATLTPTQRRIQISSVDIDTPKTKRKDGSSTEAFTVIAHTSPIRKDKALQKMQESIADEEKRALNVNAAGSSANQLIVEAVVNGQDYSMLSLHFLSGVNGAINVGRKIIIAALAEPVQSLEYYKGVTWIGVTAVIPAEDVSMPRTVVAAIAGGDAERRDPAELFKVTKTEDTTPNGLIKEDSLSSKESEKPPMPPMNARAVEFRIISGSIFLSLCITVILANTIRILSKQREHRKRRMAKAKQAYEGPTKKAALGRGSASEKRFVGMLDNGDAPRV